MINRDFTWVRSEMYNVGVEFSVLRNKLNFELDFYKKHKSGKLKIRRQLAEYVWWINAGGECGK